MSEGKPTEQLDYRCPCCRCEGFTDGLVGPILGFKASKGGWLDYMFRPLRARKCDNCQNIQLFCGTPP